MREDKAPPALPFYISPRDEYEDSPLWAPPRWATACRYLVDSDGPEALVSYADPFEVFARHDMGLDYDSPYLWYLLEVEARLNLRREADAERGGWW